MVIDLR